MRAQPWGSHLRADGPEVDHAHALHEALAEEDGHYVAEYEDGADRAPRPVLTPLRGRRLA